MNNSWKCVIFNKNGVITRCDKKAVNGGILDEIIKITFDSFKGRGSFDISNLIPT